MRLKKLVESIELPEKMSATRYINVRANERIDVCYGDRVRVKTGVHVTVSKNETARLVEPRALVSNVVEMNITTGELFVTMHNSDERNLMIYPGEVLAEIWVEKAPVKASTRKRRTAKFTSSAKVVKGASK